MADPASILGLIAASLTITIRAAAIGKDMHTLIAKYKTTNRKVKQLSVHVAAVRVAARSLSSWLEDDAVGSEEVEDVKHELLEVLTASCSLLSDLQEHIEKALRSADTVGLKGAIHYIWDEDIIHEASETLHHQESVLMLMLHALSLSRKDQRARLQEHAVLETLTKAKRPSSSIFGVRSEPRSSAQFSCVSETTERIEEVFDFDVRVMASTVYRNAFTSLFRRNVPGRVDTSGLTMLDDESVVTITAAESVQELDSTLYHDIDLLDVDGRHDLISQRTKVFARPWRDSRTLPYEVERPGRNPRHSYARSVPKGASVDISSDDPDSGPGGLARQYFSTTSNNLPSHWGDQQNLHPTTIFSTNSKNGFSPVAHESEGPAQSNSFSGGLCRALIDHADPDPLSLAFKRGDIIQIVTYSDDEQWEGVVRGKRGYFPSSYCMMVEKTLPAGFFKGWGEPGLNGADAYVEGHDQNLGRGLDSTAVIEWIHESARKQDKRGTHSPWPVHM